MKPPQPTPGTKFFGTGIYIWHFGVEGKQKTWERGMVDVSRHGRFRVEVVSPNISASHGSGSPEKRMANRFNGPCHGKKTLDSWGRKQSAIFLISILSHRDGFIECLDLTFNLNALYTGHKIYIYSVCMFSVLDPIYGPGWSTSKSLTIIILFIVFLNQQKMKFHEST